MSYEQVCITLEQSVYFYPRTVLMEQDEFSFKNTYT